jgi:hypothetical protein
MLLSVIDVHKGNLITNNDTRISQVYESIGL